ncbi:LPS export ABC transporter periplasmic protein LptC [Legionella sp. CNM-4043-24]|uniref:LPS export ABC transporter periplasmic protein LptC n=1 Tax=Legionella sp. CNM-4043-24 TaxID=3421646 RepID=UPI00403A9999
MNAARQAAWLFCAMIALACSGWYFASTPVPVKLDEQTLANTPDYVIQGFALRQYDAKGTLINFIESPRLEHIPNQDTNLISSPHITVKQDDLPAWDIRSEQAKAINRGDSITFTKNVIIHQGKGRSNQPSTFKTEELVYFPKKKYATSNAAVIFEQPGSVVHANGMNAWLEDRHVELLGKTHATYEPDHAQG